MSDEEKIKQSTESSLRSTENNQNISQQNAIAQTETENSKHETDNMEVHHHPHVEKKNFKEYFFEFLMIFLAVTLGFFAESLREHIVDKEREREYISSFYTDLQSDQRDLPVLINAIKKQQVQPGESLPLLLSKASITTPADSIYYFLRRFIRQQGIKAFVTDKTIDQIKNAGEMRLITNKQIADSLVNYYKEIVMIDYLQQTLLGFKSKLLDNIPLILKSADYRDNACTPCIPFKQ